MSVTSLDGKILKNMLIGGVENLRANSQEINDLNVFPVPDGDTGTNMTLTLDGGVTALSGNEDETVSGVADKFAMGVLLGARGNSGVILSQIFAGIKEVLSKYGTVTALELAEAYKQGVKKSYAAVSNPTEGTILTVFRESTEYASANIDESSSIDDFLRLHIDEAQRSLARTKELLPALKEADVVDSGGAGYLCVVAGMYSVLTGEMKNVEYKAEAPAAATLDFDRFTRSSVMKRGYCTEFLLRLTEEKVDPDSFDVGAMIAILELLGGESIVAYKEGDIVKVHVHTLDPGRVLTSAREFGEFLTVKIENMELGHSDTERLKKKPKKPFAVVTVAKGEGICSLFRDMGADGIISGGQTDNPSTEEFIEAFRQVEAEDIIVLPNNKNVMLAARQAAELYTDSRIHIVPTATLMEGYGALSVITPGITDIDAIVESAERAAKSIFGGEITKAVRDVTIGGVEVHEGDYISIAGGKITSVAKDRDTALLDMLDSACDMDEYEIITLFVGEDVDDDARVEITDKLEDKYPEQEVIVYKGKQALYDYLIAVE
ncbi:MAG: DAK2 domain-containing protein [Clostridia bacterium]|nr:DAK2 domain-containing protein [Clostridia bacterium]